MTRETFGMVLVLFAFLSLLCLITDDLVFGKLGYYVSAFLLGLMGYCSYAVMFALIVTGVLLVSGKKVTARRRAVFGLLTLVLSVVALVHCITSASLPRDTYGKYIAACYNAGDGGISTSTAGGVVFSLVIYPVLKLFRPVGAYILFSLIIASVLYYMYRLASGKTFPQARAKGNAVSVSPLSESVPPAADALPQAENGAIVYDRSAAPAEATHRLYHGSDAFGLKSKRDLKSSSKNDSLKILYPTMGEERGSLDFGAPVSAGKTYAEDYSEDLLSKINYIKTPPEYRPSEYARGSAESGAGISRPIESKKADMPPKILHGDEDSEVDLSGRPSSLPFARKKVSRTYVAPPEPRELFGEREQLQENRENREEAELPPTNVPPVIKSGESRSRELREERAAVPETPLPRADEAPGGRRYSAAENLGESSVGTPIFGGRDRAADIVPEPVAEQEVSVERRARGLGESVLPTVDFTPSALMGGEEESAAEEMPLNYRYVAPPVELFSDVRRSVDGSEEDFEAKTEIIENTLDGFNIPAKVVNLVHGPTVTRYELEMPPGISVNKVPPLQNDIAMRLESPSGVLIEAPIPGKNLLGIQVPNKVKATVGMREIVQSDQFVRSKKTSLTFVVGKDVVGNPVVMDLAKTPHLLVAGTTGSGKSVCLNCMITSLIAKYSPEELRLILIDPKQVEFEVYAHLPHLMIDEIVSESDKTISVLNWAIAEMERRYTLFRDNVVKDIDDYNASIDLTVTRRLPKIVIIVDELSDLMSTSQDEIERRLLRIAQKARSAGIHMVLATQRPSVDVITGVIKANLPSKIAFRVTSGVDSRTILDEQGAEKLLGYGDMLIKALSIYRNVERVQGAYIPDQDVKKITAFIRENNKAYFDRAAEQAINASPASDQAVSTGESGAITGGSDDDQLFTDALQSVITTGVASISMLQRRFSLGYARAGKIIDQMEKMGYISAFQGSKSRQVLITQDEYDEKYGRREE